MAGDEGGAGSFDALRRRDEILQMMFWLRGEGFQETVEPADLLRFLPAGPEGTSESTVRDDLQKLASDGLLEKGEGGRYRLTALGLREGGRRFDDEFADLRSHGGHGQCEDPDCFCRSDPERAVECRQSAESHA